MKPGSSPPGEGAGWGAYELSVGHLPTNQG